MDNRNAQTRGAFFDQRNLVRMNVTRGDASFVLHRNCCGKALSARRGAAVEHPHPRLCARSHRRKPCRRVLHIDLAGGKKLQLRQVSRSAHQIAAIQPRMLLEGNAQLRQRLLCLLCIG